MDKKTEEDYFAKTFKEAWLKNQEFDYLYSTLRGDGFVIIKITIEPRKDIDSNSDLRANNNYEKKGYPLKPYEVTVTFINRNTETSTIRFQVNIPKSKISVTMLSTNGYTIISEQP